METQKMAMPTKTPLISHPPQSFVLKLKSKNTHNDHIFLDKSKSNDKELDVFAAEKYFNEVDNNSPKLVVSKNLQTDHHAKKDELPLDIFGNKPKPAKTTTKSIRSESSWNSRCSLLQTVPKNQQPKRINKKSFFACNNCSCVGKKSVDVDKNKTGHFVTDYGSVKLNEPEHEKIKPGPHFTFPIFNRDQPGKIKTRVEEKDIIFTKRSKSLKVFDGPENRELGSGLEKKLAMMTWTIPSISSEMRDDESDVSDASSDLFEIESLTRNGPHTDPWKGAAASEGCKSPTVMTSYAPSEASVEWSVMTASVADFGELNGSDLNPSNNPGPKKIGSFKEMPRLRTSGILSGCTSKKAIMTKSRDEIKK
ncbi:hypothetical protein CASFOL_003909 [Castilleja foliolosa]|uniref:Phytochrome kinase substrate 1 n=1 Tax=Castilleja foliolosa TaxID=1961234 RepID=A0ABD3EIV4_9LAMI